MDAARDNRRGHRNATTERLLVHRNAAALSAWVGGPRQPPHVLTEALDLRKQAMGTIRKANVLGLWTVHIGPPI